MQISEEGPDTISNWGHIARFLRYPCRQVGDRVKNSAPPKKNGLAPEIPEDLYMLIKKAVSVRKHMERNRADKDSKFRLILIESRIHRLARYYRTTRKLHAAWK